MIRRKGAIEILDHSAYSDCGICKDRGDWCVVDHSLMRFICPECFNPAMAAEKYLTQYGIVAPGEKLIREHS